MHIPRAVGFITFLLLTQQAFAQVADRDTSYITTATAELRNRYYAERKSESLLYTGSDYAEYEAIANEHPFFLTDDWIYGEVRYSDNTYTNIPLQFDIYRQKLITEHPASGRKLELIPEHVSWFTIANHQFVRLNESNVPQGYYELLADGKARLLAKHSKAFQESTVTGKLEVRTEENTKYFIYSNAALLPVRSKATLLDALADRKTELAQEIRSKRINFRHDRQQAMIQTVKVYNSLPKP
ncbi:MAG TPA: hypothetical protein VGD65_01560 [Chryseosolibacter sp.]